MKHRGDSLGALNPIIYQLAGADAFHSAASMSSDISHVGLGSPKSQRHGSQVSARNPRRDQRRSIASGTRGAGSRIPDLTVLTFKFVHCRCSRRRHQRHRRHPAARCQRQHRCWQIGHPDFEPGSSVSITPAVAVSNLDNGARRPDGCLYTSGGGAVFKITDQMGGCSFTSKSRPAAPMLTLAAIHIPSNPAQGLCGRFRMALSCATAGQRPYEEYEL